MRVVLVGSVTERARLRAALTDASLDVVGEARHLEADAFLVASDHHDSADAELATDSPDSADLAYSEPLTRREIEVLELLAEGLPNKAIALRLDISDQTVKFHVSSICGKLSAANRTDAVRRAVRQGLITL